jgi:transcriptional regulator with XRE-family HTH domain
MKRIVEAGPAAQCGRSIWVLVGDRLRARRARMGLTIESVAAQLGVEPGTYERYEDGMDQAPALLLTEVAEKLDVPVLWFFQDVIAQDVPAKVSAPVHTDQAPVYRVATVEDRVQAMADRFRKLDFEGQQHLLSIASALARSDGDARSEALRYRPAERALKTAPRRLPRSAGMHNRKSK